MHKLSKILLTIPQTSITVEQFFPVNRIKTRLRSRTGTARLLVLSLHLIERNLCIALDKQAILHHF